jgi:hypothetical protein
MDKYPIPYQVRYWCELQQIESIHDDIPSFFGKQKKSGDSMQRS